MKRIGHGSGRTLAVLACGLGGIIAFGTIDGRTSAQQAIYNERLQENAG